MRHALALLALLAAAPAMAQLVKAPPPDFLSEQARRELAANDARPAEPTDMAGRRARSEAIQQDIGQRRLARFGVRMTEATIAGVPVRIFEKGNPPAGAPLLLNLHGGGFVVDSGSITENVHIAALTGWRVVAVRYRLIPENPFPAAVDDALAVYRALLAERPGRRIGLYGTSAGAILSAQLVARLQAEHLPLPAALGFFSGSADLSRPGDSLTLFGDPRMAGGLVALYAGKASPADPLFAPLNGDLSGWPPTLCVTSGRDILLSATADFCRKLDAAGTPQTLLLYDGLPHAFWSYIDSPETDDAFAAMARFLKSRLGK